MIERRQQGATEPAAYLTERKFCDTNCINPRTAQRWRVTGEGPAWVRLGERRIIYRVSDCESWAAARTYRHRAAEIADQREVI